MLSPSPRQHLVQISYLLGYDGQPPLVVVLQPPADKEVAGSGHHRGDLGQLAFEAHTLIEAIGVL